jgi:ABC-type multidrug transport system ATPase subunit
MSQSKFAPIAVRVEHLWLVKGSNLFSEAKSILQDASFSVAPGQFVAVIGPNGAGKTTLFKSLIGDRPSRGQILFYRDNGTQDNFEDFYDNPEYWMQLIGYIPVDNVLHEELTVLQALMHVGRLRLPDASDKAILGKIQATIEKLGFNHDDYRLQQFVGTLSSGERKKMNIAAELLTDPPLLLLDEPTSNLDPNAERDLMNSLKLLAGSANNGQGPTILLITHTLETLDRCDQVVFVENSRLVADGDIEQVFESMREKALEFAAQSDEEYVIPTERDNRFEHWAFVFDAFKTDEARAERKIRKPPAYQPHTQAKQRYLAPDSFWRQFKIVLNRYFMLRINDLNGITAMLWSGFIAGFLLLIAPSDIFLETDDATAARQTVVLYTILVVIMGAFNSHREISKEFRIYVHERIKGLKPLAYIMSKVVWLSVVVGIISTITIMALSGTPIARWLALLIGLLLFGLAVWHTLTSPETKFASNQEKGIRIFRFALVVLPLILAFFVQLQQKSLPETPINPAIVELVTLGSLMLASFAAITTGLFMSAAVGNNNDRATQLTIAFILFNVILAFSVLVVASPEFKGLFDTLEPFAASYWAYGGMSSSISVYCWAGLPVLENFNSAGHILSTWLYLITHIIVTLALGVVALRLQETWTTRIRTVSRMTSLAEEGFNYVVVAAVICVLSWAVFLTQMSQQYFDLTFFDRLFGANRYADIANLQDATGLQWFIGTISQSPCEIVSSSESEENGDSDDQLFVPQAQDMMRSTEVQLLAVPRTSMTARSD